jgi:hypothetical protein
MVEELTLIQKSNVGGEEVIDGIYAVLINADDAQTDAQTAAEAVAQLIAAGHPVPDTYFDGGTYTNAMQDLTAGPMGDDLDMLYFRGDGVGAVGVVL